MSLVRATRSELTKQFSTSMWWILGLVLVAYVGSTAGGLAGFFGAVATGAIPGGSTDMSAIPGGMLPPLIYSLATAVGYIFPLLIGTLLVTGEFRHKTLTPTFLATPRRSTVLAGKVVAGIVMGLVYALAALVSTVGPGAGFLAVFGVDTQLGDLDTWAMFGRIAIAFALWVLIGIGVGTLVRNQVAAVVGVIAFTQFVEPILRTVGSFVDGIADAARFLPGAASDALVGASLYSTLGSGTGAGSEPLAWWIGGLVLLAYAAVILVLGYLTSWRRDVG